jgi:1-phosphatidylinositol-4-phosphate 5-kinase
MSGQKHGWGKYSWPSGATYLGEWKQGYLHGYGTFHSPDGSKYQGNWENNQKDGIGTKWLANGDRHEGLYLQDKPHGPGRYLFASGDEFDGEFREGKFHGQGTFKWISKHRYDGEWFQGAKNGIGVFTWPDGATYEGFWQNGVQHGVGVFRPSRLQQQHGHGHNHQSNFNISSGGGVVGIVAATANAPAAAAAAGAHIATAAFQHLSDPAALFTQSFLPTGLTPPQPLPQPPHAVSPPITRPGSPTAPNSPTTNATTASTTSDTIHHINNTNNNNTSTTVYACEYRLGELILEEALQPEDLDYVFGTASHSKKHSQGTGNSGTSNYIAGHGPGSWKLMARQSLVPRRRRPKKEERMGETIYKGSPSFDLMLNLQLGIRYTLTTLSKLPPLTGPLEKAHFEEKVWLRFPRQGSEVTPPHPSNDFKWKDYSPIVFRQLRGLFGISNSEYILSTCGDHALRELPSPGKSGSVFFVSQDERFIIKTMRKEEVKLLLRTLPLYYAHVASHPDTLISRFYGIHRITLASGRKARFVVMNNIFVTEMPLHKKYDLKGSTYKRTATIRGGSNSSINANGISGSSSSNSTTPAAAGGPVVILKDLDLTTAFQLKKPVVERLQRQLAADTEFLQAADVMDYSLLLGVHYRGQKETNTSSNIHKSAGSGGDGGGGQQEKQQDMTRRLNGTSNNTAALKNSSEDNELMTPTSSVPHSRTERNSSNQSTPAITLPLGVVHALSNGTGGTSGVNMSSGHVNEGDGDDISPLIIRNSMSFSAKMAMTKMQQEEQQQQQQKQQQQQEQEPSSILVAAGSSSMSFGSRFMLWRRDKKEKKRQKAEQASGLSKIAMAPPPTPAPPLSLEALHPTAADGGGGYYGNTSHPEQYQDASGLFIPSSPSLSSSSGAAAAAAHTATGAAPFNFHRRTTSATAALGSINSLFSSPAVFQLGIGTSSSTAPSSPVTSVQQRPGSGPIFRTTSAARIGGGGGGAAAGTKNKKFSNNAMQHHLKVTYSDQLMEQHAALVASLANWGIKNNTGVAVPPMTTVGAAGEAKLQKDIAVEDFTTPTKQINVSNATTTLSNDENASTNTNLNNDHINYRADAAALPIDSSVVEPTTPSSARVSNVFTRNFSTTLGTGGEVFLTPFTMQKTPQPQQQQQLQQQGAAQDTPAAIGAAVATDVQGAPSASPLLGKNEDSSMHNTMAMSYSEAFDGLSDDEAQAMVLRLTTRLSRPIEERLALDLLRLARHKMLGTSSRSGRGGGGSGGNNGSASSRLPTAVLAAARQARLHTSNSMDRKGLEANPTLAMMSTTTTTATAVAVGGDLQQDCELEPAVSLSRDLPAIAVPLDPTPGILSAHTVPTTASIGGASSGGGGDSGEVDQDVALFLGVIDWLQPYNARKRLEHGFKSVILDSRAISVCEPRAYAKRFLNFMSRVFVAERDEEQNPAGGGGGDGSNGG